MKIRVKEKLKQILIIILLMGISYQIGISRNVKETKIIKPLKLNKVIKYNHFKKHLSWLTPFKYKIILKHAKAKQIKIEYILALIQAESGGRNIISRRNRNGSRDYGVMQVNEIHFKKNPRKLLNFNYNIHKGTSYIRYSIKKARQRFGKSNLWVVSMLYNGGVNVNAKKYKNWGYIKNINRWYIKLNITNDKGKEVKRYI